MAEKHKPLPFFSEKIITLWNMKDFPSANLIHVMFRLKDSKNLASMTNPGLARKKIVENLREAIVLLNEIELNLSAQGLNHLIGQVQSDCGLGCVQALLDSQISGLDDEVKSHNYFMIEPDKAGYYRNYKSAGKDFEENLPISNKELMHAGNCFSLDEYTACVCHLMRAVEGMLKLFANKIGADISKSNTWGSIISKIEEKRGTYQNNGQVTLDDEWKKNKDFNEKCLTLIKALKENCRDDVFHSVRTYDEHEARTIMNLVLAMAVACAKELKEPK